MSLIFHETQATAVTFGSKLNTLNVGNMSNMFSDSKIKTFDLRKFNTSNVANMNNMFLNSELSSIDLRSFNASKVITMVNMFYGSKAKAITFGTRFNTSNVTDMHAMLRDSNAISLNLSSLH